jgi:hypothetical protein
MKKLMLCLALVTLSFAALATPTHAQRPPDGGNCRIDCCSPYTPYDYPCYGDTPGITTCGVWLEQNSCWPPLQY